MKKRQLGNSDLYVSELGLGCMSLPQDEKEAADIIETTLHAGINFFDTADLYESGKNEELVGRLISRYRDEIILATKVGNKMNPDGEGWTWNPTKKHIIEAVKDSLLRLGTDRIDLYQLHGGMMEDDVDETIDAFETLKKEGIIRQYGISSIRPNVIKRFLSKSGAVSVMMQYSLLDRRPEQWFPLIHEYGASVITRGTLAKGLLTIEGKDRAGRGANFGTYSNEALIDTLGKLNSLNEDIHAGAIAFNLSNDTVASALVGASSKTQLLDSVIAYEEHVSRAIIDEMAKAVKTDQYEDHLPKA